MSKNWTAEDEQFLQKHYALWTLPQLCEKLQRTKKAICSKAKILRLTRGNKRPWTPEEEQYVREHYRDTNTKVMAKHLNRTVGMVYQKADKFGLEKSDEYRKDPANHCGLQKGANVGAAFRFKKGQVPPNKGLRRPGWAPGRMAETQFKPGQRSGKAAENWVPIGTIKADTEGFLRIKVREAVHGAEATGFGNTKVWPLLNRHVWEQHKGPIPPGHVVAFKDKNRNNCDIDNLELLSLKDNMARNTIWNPVNMPKEIAELIQLKGAINRQINKQKEEQHAN